MGLSASRFASAGTLRGAYAPPLKDVPLPAPLDPKLEKRYNIVVPDDKGPGDTMNVTINGHDVGIRIPQYVKNDRGQSRKIQPGDKFPYTYRERSRVIASTLPALPGAVIVESKPIIYSNVSKAFFTRQFNDQREQTEMSAQIGLLMQETQDMLLQKAVEAGCNAVLGINTNVTIDSAGENGNSKIVIVTFTGTPCVVSAAERMPVVAAKATLVPDYY